MAFSADGSLLASATAEQLDIFDVLTGTLQFSLPCASLPGHTLPPLQVDFTVDGLLMVSCRAQSSACQCARLFTFAESWSVSFWRPTRLTALSALQVTSIGDKILQLTAWNLLTRQVAWTARLPAQLVSVSKHSSLIVVARWKASPQLQNDADTKAKWVTAYCDVSHLAI